MEKLDTPKEWLLPPKTYLSNEAPKCPIHHITLEVWPFCDCCPLITWVRSDLPPAYNVIEEDSSTGKLITSAVYRITIYHRKAV